MSSRMISAELMSEETLSESEMDDFHEMIHPRDIRMMKPGWNVHQS